MKNKRVKRASGLIGVIFLLTCLLSSVSPIFAAAEEGSAWDALQTKYSEFMNPNDPDNFATSTNPTGTDDETPLLICEENELLSFQSYDNQKTEDHGGSSKLYLTDRPQNSTDKVDVSNDLVENLKKTTAGIYGLNGVQAVAFDPEKTGRKDHVAFVGIDQKKVAYLVIYNAVNKTWSEKTKINAGLDWINTSDTNAYQIKDVLSITAGDYNRDFHDTVVVFASFYGTDNDIFEFQVDDLIISQISDGQNGATLLHPNYIDPDYASYFYQNSDKNKWGRNQIHAQLETGDVNNDGVDDLVCLSWMNKPDKMTDNVFYYRTMSPYLNVSLGSQDSGTVLKGKTNYVGNYMDSGDSGLSDGSRMTNTLYAPGMAVGEFTYGAGDSIVVAGRGNKLTTKKNQNTCDKYELQDTVSLVTVGFNPDGSMQTPVFTQGGLGKMNELTPHTAMDKDAICSSTLEAVAFDGLNSADYLFFDGDIYTISDGAPSLVAAFASTQKSGKDKDKKLWGDYGDITYISSTAVGNFDGDENYYETIYFTMMTKNDESQDDYHCRTIQIYGSKRDDISKKITEWSCTAKRPSDNSEGSEYALDLDDKGDNFDQGLADIVVAVDCDEDGTLLKYQDKACLYSDPEICAILQATPYFEELNENDLTDVGWTSISFAESYGSSTGKDNSYDLSTGVQVDVDVEVYAMSLSAAYARNVTTGWEKSMYYENAQSFAAYDQDKVVVYRTPVYIYAYQVWNAKDHCFDKDNLFYSYVAQKPVYKSMTVNEYDEFAAAYNKGMAEKTAELKKEGKETYEYEELTILSDNSYADLLGHEGDPYGYQNEGGRTLSANAVQLGIGSGYEENEYTQGCEYSSYKSTGNGVNIATEQTGGIEAVKVGVNLETNLMWSNSSSTTKGTSVTYDHVVGDVKSNAFINQGYLPSLASQYNFNWQAKVYDTNIKGKGVCVGYDDSGNPIENDTVQIVGYKLDSVSSPPVAPVVNKEVEYDEDSDSLIISWEKSEDAKHGYRVLLQTDPDLLTYEIVENGTISNQNITSFRFDDFEDDVTEYVFAVQAIDEDNNYGLRSNDVTGTIPEVRATGRSILSGSGEPKERLGKTGDYYIETTSKDFYRKNADGWKRVGNLQNYNFNDPQNIIAGGVNIDVYCGSNVSRADQELIESKVNAGKLKIENIDEDVRQKVLNSVLALMLADNENNLTQEDINIFLSIPENKIELTSYINVLVKSASIIGANEPYIEYMVNAKVCAHIVSEEMGLDKTYYYQVNPSDFAENASIDMELPVCGKYIPESVEHMSNDGNKTYDIYTEDGAKQFVYDESTGIVKFTADHFSCFRINGKAGTNTTKESAEVLGVNVNTGVMNNDQTSLCLAIVLLMLAGVTYFVFVKKRMEE